MMAPAATALGVHLRALVESPGSSAAQALVDAPVGRPDEPGAVARLVAGQGGPVADVLTFEHEHVPATVLAEVEAGGTPVRPSAAALLHAQDKIAMRHGLSDLGVPVPRWTEVPDRARLERFIADCGGVAVVKTARGGYDGKGVRVVRSADEVGHWLEAARSGEGPALLAEERVPFVRELAVLLARRPSGELRHWPVVQTVQVDGVCSEVVAPAPDLDPAVAQAAVEAARAIAEGLEVTGVLAVEMFEVAAQGGRPAGVLVNELAMRPHNSGHWTIDGAVTSQFEQHLRAVLDLPLGETSPRASWSVMANVLGTAHDHLAAALGDVLGADPGARVHLYGKEIRPGRKLGHVTVCGEDLGDVTRRARAAAALLRGE